MSQPRTSAAVLRARNSAKAAPATSRAKAGARRKRVIATLSLVTLALTGAGVLMLRERFISAPEVVAIQAPGEVDSAVLEDARRLQSVVRATPRSAAAHGELGACYETNGLKSEALACYRNAESLDPANPAWLFHQAVCLQSLHRGDEALEVLARLTQENPTHAPGLYRYGEGLLLKDQLDQAEQCFQRVAKLCESEPNGFFGLAEVYNRRRRYQDAKSNAERAIALAPEYRAAHYSLGMALRGLGRLDEAEREMSVGKEAPRWYLGDELDPLLDKYGVNTKDAINKAMKLAQLNRRPEAEAVLDKALQAHPDDLALLNNLAAICIDTAKYEKGSELLTRATRIDAGNFGPYINLSVCSARTGNMTQALEYADKAVALAPNVAQTHLNRANMLIAMKRDDEALLALQQAAKFDTRNVDVFTKQGDIFVKQKRWEDAFNVFSTAAQLAPQVISIHLNRGVMAAFLGRLQEARESLAAAEQISPDDPKVITFRNSLAKLDD